jgi:hypothetical protein
LIERAERAGERETERERDRDMKDTERERERDQKGQGMWNKPVTLAGSKSSLSTVPKSVLDDAEGVGTSSGKR